MSPWNDWASRPPARPPFILFKTSYFRGDRAIGLAIAVVWLSDPRDTAVGAKILFKLGQEQSLPPTALGERPMIVGQRTQDVNSEADILQSAELIAKVVDHLELDKPDTTPPPERLIKRIRYEIKRGIRWVKDGVDTVMIAIGLREQLSPRERAILALQRGIEVTPPKDSNNRCGAHLSVRVGPAFIEYTARLLSQSRSKIFRTPRRSVSSKAGRGEPRDPARGRGQRRFEGDSASARSNARRTCCSSASRPPGRRSTRRGSGWPRRRQGRAPSASSWPDPDLAAIGEFGANRSPVAPQPARGAPEQRESCACSSSTSVPIRTTGRSSRCSPACWDRTARGAQRGAGRYDARRATVKVAPRIAALRTKTGSPGSSATPASGWNYLFYEQKLEEAHAAAALERSHVGNAVVIERAMDPLAPTGLRKTTLLGICLGVTLLVALAWISVLEFFDHRIYSAEELERELGAPVLAVVPTEKRSRKA
jgi:hypothetical protein